jgi:hypothetical protein
MAPTIEQLEAMNDGEVRAQYNAAATELVRGAVNRQTETLVRLTYLIAFLSVVSTVAALPALFK